jgi:3-oxoacyl-[acyl-carrier protein] reductase
MTSSGRRVALITGGGTGIGAACAGLLGADGCQVILVGRRRDALERTAAQLHPAAHVLPADVTDPDQVEALAHRVREDFGIVDVLVNNAGAPAGPEGNSLQELADAWTATFRINTLSAVMVTTALEPLLRDNGGRVVIVGSRAASTGAATASYTAAKAAVEGYVRAIAPRLAERAITINVVAPGFTEDTELTVGRISDERRKRILASVILRRPGRPEEIGAVIAFLASPGAAYITGEVLAVDGGFAPWRGPGD